LKDDRRLPVKNTLLPKVRSLFTHQLVG
jgi:hypothetical protein